MKVSVLAIFANESAFRSYVRSCVASVGHSPNALSFVSGCHRNATPYGLFSVHVSFRTIVH